MWQTVSHLLSEYFASDFILRQKMVLPGGELHKAWHISDDIHHIFIKANTTDCLSDFKSEAEQLTLLAKSKSLCIPKVYGVGSTRDASFLLLEYLPMRPLDAHHAYLFGQQLARLHQWEEQPQFGLDFDNLLVTSPQPNGWQRRWSQFFAEQRIGWQLQLAAEKGITFGDIDKIVQKIECHLQGHQPQPSLLHGDLWPNNMGLSSSDAVVFDPACYWGDRECDLAMLPHYPQLPIQIYDGYQSIWPLSLGFIQRQPIYQLYYQLNRCHLYGGSHLATTSQLIEQLMQ